MQITLESLPDLCLADPVLALPHLDVFGTPTGQQYHAYPEVKVRKFTLGHAGLEPHRDDGIAFPFSTKDERELDYIIGSCSMIVESRHAYTFKSIEAARKCLASPTRILPVNVPMVRANRMLTVVLKDAPDRFHYHAIFLSEWNFNRAQTILKGVDGVSREWIDMNKMPQVRIRNAKFCCDHMVHGDLHALADAAQSFAEFALPFMGPPNTLEQSMHHIKRALEKKFHAEVMQRGESIDANYLYQLLSVAVARDYLPRKKEMLLAFYLPFPVVR